MFPLATASFLIDSVDAMETMGAMETIDVSDTMAVALDDCCPHSSTMDTATSMSLLEDFGISTMVVVPPTWTALAPVTDTR